MKESDNTILMAIFVLISLKIIDFSNLQFLDICILILFAVWLGLKISDHFRRNK